MIDQFMARQYHARSYNCAHLVCEFFEQLQGPAVGEVLRAFLCAPRDRHAVKRDLKRAVLLSQPVSPCVVLMQRPKGETHVGVWWKGKVLHIDAGKGVQYQPLDVVSLGFKRVRFFTC